MPFFYITPFSLVLTGWDNSSHYSTCDGDFEGKVFLVIWSHCVVTSVCLPVRLIYIRAIFFSGIPQVKEIY